MGEIDFDISSDNEVDFDINNPKFSTSKRKDSTKEFPSNDVPLPDADVSIVPTPHDREPEPPPPFLVDANTKSKDTSTDSPN